MKQHLNTLFVTTQGAYLAKDGAAVAVRIEKKVRLRLPLHNLDGIVCFGRIGVSPSLLGACGQAGVAVTYLSLYGKLLARVLGFTSGNVLLRKQQYRISDSLEFSGLLAKSFVTGKISNCRSVLMRSARDSSDEGRSARLRAAVDKLKNILLLVQQSPDLESIRGLEGEAANIYFGAFNDTLIGDSAFRFEGRSRRPPLDRINAMLSFLYTVLAADVRSACESTGLDSQVGFLHRDRPGRPSLALDLMEELRAVMVDRLVMTLVNRRQISPKSFTESPTGGVLMDDATRKLILTTWQERKQEKIEHEFLGESISLGLLPHIQARLLARFLRGDLDAYPPHFWK